MIRGIPVTLLQLSRSGDSPSWTPVTVDNVLVAPVLEVDNQIAMLPDGHRAVYHLGIPKSDTHRWEGQLVQFFGQTWSVIGIPTEGIDSQIPGPWNKKVTVELYRTAAPDPDSLWRDSVDLIPVTATKDAEGYDVTTEGTPRAVTAIFARGVDGEIYSSGDKKGTRQTATAEIWTGDYQGETLVRYAGADFRAVKMRNPGRGTVLLDLEEVWR